MTWFVVRRSSTGISHSKEETPANPNWTKDRKREEIARVELTPFAASFTLDRLIELYNNDQLNGAFYVVPITVKPVESKTYNSVRRKSNGKS